MSMDNETEARAVANKYRCFMHSTSGMYAQYEGHVDVWCDSDAWADVFAAAVRELRRTSFPDRGAHCWRMDDFLLVQRGQA
jgi:hypothetical protein